MSAGFDHVRDQQRVAADPAASVWVSANAGAGKTHVLIDRVVRLLLAGSAPERILCLTFTKAAAAEMQGRLFRRLGAWAVMDEFDLSAQLTELLGHAPGPSLFAVARRLFARAIETPGGLKIQTIHAFCERLLGRFPLEAQVAPHFDVLDERSAQELLAEARDVVLARAEGGDDPSLSDALEKVAYLVNEMGFGELVDEVVSQRARFEALIQTHGGVGGVIAALRVELGLNEDDTEANVVVRACELDDALEGALRDVAEALEGGKKTDLARAELIKIFLESKDRADFFDEYFEAFFTQKGTPRAALATKAVLAAHSGLEDVLRDEQDRLDQVRAAQYAAFVAEATGALTVLAHALLYAFDSAKRRHAYLDYDDLIVRTRDLLAQSEAASWVLYKLDGGLDHILVDEAQDTSPDQWQVIQKLAEEFLSGEGTRTDAPPRTVFAVGDEKQSIYSFQGADPREFDTMRRFFASRVEAVQLKWQAIDLIHSFRSAPEVLRAVDAVFGEEEARKGLQASGAAIGHASLREGAPGMVELWPTVRPEEDADEAPWDVPLDYRPSSSPRVRLAERIADTIAGWISNRTLLPTEGRPIEAKDVLILVRRRRPFADEMIRALKARDVPVAGTDRMILTEQIAVMDLMALASFTLLPEDDLTLAIVLKTPLFGFDDDDLLSLAWGRAGSLWRALREKAAHEPRFGEAVRVLGHLMARVDFIPPFEFFADVLGPLGARRKIIGRLGSEAEDPLNEFMNLALEFETLHPPSMQGFLHWIEAGATEIKRDLEHGRNEVRVMTAHGAKGLQAKIVILPDTCTVSGAQHDSKLIRAVPDEGVDSPFLLWPVRTRFDVALSAAGRLAEREARADEARRLLYVAMTRAEDWLIVCGYEGVRGRSEGCWYNLVEQGLAPIAREVPLAFGETGLRVGSPEPDEPIGADEQSLQQQLPKPLPEWLHVPAAPEPVPYPVLSPSALMPGEEEPTVLSPLSQDGLSRFMRGRLIHALLQTLPDLPPETWLAAAHRYLAQPTHDLGDSQVDEIAREVLMVLETPTFAPLFAPGSRAEVPLVGKIQTSAGPVSLSGQVDRLVVGDGDVMVADYKTNRPPPQKADDIPAVYVAQMAAYRALLRGAFPDKAVHCVLVWTDGPTLMPVPEGQLDRALTKLCGEGTG